jgi:hypothetical protein
MRARRAREIDGLVVRVKVTIDLRSRHSTKRMHAVQGLWNPSSSLTRGPLGAWGSLHLTPGPLTCGARRARELMGWLCQSYDRFTIAPLDQTNECRAGGYGGPLGAWGSRSQPSDMRGTQG